MLQTVMTYRAKSNDNTERTQNRWLGYLKEHIEFYIGENSDE